jgi:hypothetical protein
MSLSVSVAITASLETNIDQRLEWLQTVLTNIDLNDPDMKEMTPKIMDILSSRLQGAYMSISERSPGEAALKRISALHRQVGEVRRVVG